MSVNREIREYLLGGSPEPRRTEIEERLFTDKAFLDQVEATEDELMDDYASGALSKRERLAWEAYMASHPDSRARLDFSRAAQARFARQPPAHAAWGTWWWWIAAPAFAVLLWMVVPRPGKVPASPPPVMMAAITVPLRPGIARSAAEAAQVVALPAGPVLLRLDFQNAGDTAVRAEIREVGGAAIWSGPLAKGIAEVDGKLFRDGADYVATLSDASGEELADYGFRVSRQ